MVSNPFFGTRNDRMTIKGYKRTQLKIILCSNTAMYSFSLYSRLRRIYIKYSLDNCKSVVLTYMHMELLHEKNGKLSYTGLVLWY